LIYNSTIKDYSDAQGHKHRESRAKLEFLKYLEVTRMEKESPAMKVADRVEDGDSSSSSTPLSDLGLKKAKLTDVFGDLDDEPFIDAPMREFTYSGGIFSKQALAFNPLSSFIGIGVLWGLAIW
jgi:hypothetical protein